MQQWVLTSSIIASSCLALYWLLTIEDKITSDTDETNLTKLYKNEGVAPDFLTLLKLQTCKTDECRTTITLVETALQVFEQHPNNLEKVFHKIKQLQDQLINPQNKQYVWIGQRDGIGKYAEYMMRGSGDKNMIDIPMTDVQNLINKRCDKKECDFKLLNDYLFSETNTTDKRCALITIPGYDPITLTTVLKRNIVYRWNDDIILGSGYTIKSLESYSPKWTIVTIMSMYILYLLIVFVYPGLSTPIAPRVYYWITATIFSLIVVGYGTMHARYSTHSVFEDYVNQIYDNYYMWKNPAWIIIQLAVLSLAFLFFFHSYPNPHVHKNDYFDVTKLLIFTVAMCVASGMFYVVRNKNKLFLHLFSSTLNIALLNVFWIFFNLYTY